MRVKHHFLIGATLAVPMVAKSPLGALIFFAVSFLLDIDHYVFFSFHEKHFSFFPLRTINLYKEWDYFGPRINFFHNYEILFLTGFCWLQYSGVYGYLFLSVLVHLGCDFVPTYRRFHFNRIRSFIGDIFRYKKYLMARKQGCEREFMLYWRNSWWAHLSTCFPARTVAEIRGECGVLQLYGDVPLDGKADCSIWRAWY